MKTAALKSGGQDSCIEITKGTIKGKRKKGGCA